MSISQSHDLTIPQSHDFMISRSHELAISRFRDCQISRFHDCSFISSSLPLIPTSNRRQACHSPDVPFLLHLYHVDLAISRSHEPTISWFHDLTISRLPNLAISRLFIYIVFFSISIWRSRDRQIMARPEGKVLTPCIWQYNGWPGWGETRP